MRRPELVMEELVRQGLEKAEQDLAAARHLLEGKPLLAGVAAFHAQQAAEKFLKAFLVQHQIEFPRTHNIQELLHLVSSVDAPLAAMLRDAHDLTPYGVDVRYPADLPEVSTETGRRAWDLAARVGTAVRAAIG